MSFPLTPTSCEKRPPNTQKHHWWNQRCRGAPLSRKSLPYRSSLSRSPWMAKTARTDGTIRPGGGGVKTQKGLEGRQRLLQVGEEVLDVLDSDGNPYQSVG